MTAASFWSLLDPAFRIAREQSYVNSQINFVLIIFGFLLGAGFVYLTDLLLPAITSKQIFSFTPKKKTDELKLKNHQDHLNNFKINSAVRSRLKRNQEKLHVPIGDSPMEEVKEITDERTKWHRLLLLIIAVTLHNFPGKNQGKVLKIKCFLLQRDWQSELDLDRFRHQIMPRYHSIKQGKYDKCQVIHSDYHSLLLRNLALGIGIQNFPEGKIEMHMNSSI